MSTRYISIAPDSNRENDSLSGTVLVDHGRVFYRSGLSQVNSGVNWSSCTDVDRMGFVVDAQFFKHDEKLTAVRCVPDCKDRSFNSPLYLNRADCACWSIWFACRVHPSRVSRTVVPQLDCVVPLPKMRHRHKVKVEPFMKGDPWDTPQYRPPNSPPPARNSICRQPVVHDTATGAAPRRDVAVRGHRQWRPSGASAGC